MLTKKILVVLAILTAAGCSDDDKNPSGTGGGTSNEGGSAGTGGSGGNEGGSSGMDHDGGADASTHISFEDANEKCSAWCRRVMPLKACVKYEGEKECIADCTKLLQDNNPCRNEWYAVITCQGSNEVVCVLVPRGANNVCETPEVNWARCAFGGNNEPN